MIRVVAIIQARMESTRLPKKVMSEIVGHPMLWHIINRVKKSRFIDDIIIATTVNREDNEIEKFAKENNINVFRGSEEDVLDRFHQTAKEYNIKDIARVTADDPLKDPVVIDKVIGMYHQNKVDYASNTIEPTYPLGLDIEVLSFNALEKAWLETKEKYEREHVTPYIWRNPDRFRIINVTHERENLSHLRWTVDTEEDLNFVKVVYNELYTKEEVFLMNDVLDLLKKHPEIYEINKDVKSKNIFSR